MDHIDGLLHLGAMAVLLGVGFLGLDKIAEIRPKLQSQLLEIRQIVLRRLTKADARLDYNLAQGTAAHKTKNSCFLLYLAEKARPERPLYNRLGHYGTRFLRAPFLNSFVTGRYNTLVFCITALSMFAFLFLVNESIPPKHQPGSLADLWPGFVTHPVQWLGSVMVNHPEHMRDLCFWLFVITLATVIVVVGISRRLDSLRSRSDAYLREFEHEMDAMRESVRQQTFADTDRDEKRLRLYTSPSRR